MSKVSMPRPRYLAFEVAAGAPVPRKAFASALRAAARAGGWAESDAPQLTRYAWPHGVVRVEHLHAARARGLLAGITWAQDGAGPRAEVRVRTLATSGTLKALAARTGVLGSRDAS
ncbi:MAG: hypothetical protein QOD77_1825 [Thermoplasmata archaeon]|jgi:RNase P/RNase MRP subunit POP5|nr:hypothetical protein [Thermoplasmata archaeon]